MPRGRPPFTEEQRQRAAESRQAGAAGRKRAKVALCEVTVDALLGTSRPLPAWAAALAEKARTGNVRALIALKCADCAGLQREEIRLCTVTACPLHPLRPYKSTESEQAEPAADTA